MDILKDIVAKSGLEVELLLKDRLETGSDGTYFLDSNHIEIGIDTLNHTAERLKSLSDSITPELIGEMVVSHELGHAADTELQANQTKREQLSHFMKKYLVTGNREKLKSLYVRTWELVMKKERKAWAYAPRYFVHDIDQTLFEAYRDICLGTYEEARVREWRINILSLKLIQQMSKYRLFSQYKAEILFDVFGNHSTVYHAETNQVKVCIERLNKRRRIGFEQLGRTDYVLFQLMYEVELQQLVDEQKKVLATEELLDQYAEQGGEEAQFLHYVEEYSTKRTELLEFILSQMDGYFMDHPKYAYYREVMQRKDAMYTKHTVKAYQTIYRLSQKASVTA